MAVRGRGIPIRKSGMYFMFRHKLHVDLQKAKLAIHDITVGFQKTFITTKGKILHFDKKVKDINLSIFTNTLRIHDLYREVPPALFPQARKMSVKGTAKLMLSIKGKMDSSKRGSLPGIYGKFRIKGAEFKYADLPQSINHLNADIRFTPHFLHVKQFAFNVGKNPISLMALIKNFQKPKVDVSLKANLNLAEVKDAVKLPKGCP